MNALRSLAPRRGLAAVLLALAALSPGASAATSARTPLSPMVARTLTAARPVVAPLTRAGTELPAASNLKGGALPFAATAVSDTFLIGSYGFQDHADACRTRGWVGQDRTPMVFANVSGAALVNRDIVAGFGPPSAIALPAPLAGTVIGTPGASAADANGDLVYFDVLNGPVRVDRAGGQLRAFAPQLPGSQAWESAALDPTTGGIVVAPKAPGAPSALFAYPAGGGGAAVKIAGFGDTEEDTTVAAGALTGITQIAIDAAGNVYFTEPSLHRVRVLRRADGRLVTLAGDGTVGNSGDGGPAAAARLTDPTGIAVDPDGSRLWIADRATDRVRMVTDPLGAAPTIDTYALIVEPHYLTLSAGRLFALASYFEPVARGSVIELLAGGASAHSFGSLGNYSIYATPAQRASAQMHNVYDPGAPAPDGAGGYYTSDQVTRVVYHVKADGTVETAAGAAYGVHMGDFALRVGADMASNPEEVANWVRPDGYGNDWSQRLVSPPVPLAGATLTFDFSLELTGDLEGVLTGNSWNELLAVQFQKTDGTWQTVNLRLLDPFNGTYGTGYPMASGRGIFRGAVQFDSDVPAADLPAGPARLRFVVQTQPQGTAEDGLGAPARAAAVIDNIELRDASNTLLLAQDFESGTLGAWSLSAMNGTSTPPGVTLFYVRDTPPLDSQVELRSGFDFTDPTCVWQFTSPDGQVRPGAHARVISPWVVRADAADSIEVTFSGKLANRGTARKLRLFARGKNAGDTRPRWVTPANFILDSGLNGPDAASPFVVQRATRFPADFQPVAGGSACDSIQFFFQVEDHWEQALAFGPFQDEWGRGGTLPILDDMRIYQVGVDRDHDGIADAQDASPDVSAEGQDADGNGAIDPTATFRHVESWDRADLPLRYVVAQEAAPAITDGSDLAAVHAAFDAWTAVPGADLVLTDGGAVAQTASDPLDGVNLVTFEDVGFDFPPDIIGVTPTLSFTRQGVYDDRVVRPGQIVDADMILNPRAAFRTPTQGPAAGLDLQSVVTHEAGHLLGLNHSGVLDASMFFVIQAGTLGASLADDDRAAVAAAYPAADFAASFGAITGTVTRGATGDPVPGALVTAVLLAGGVPADSTASDYTREDGSYALRRLPAGSYAVRVTPLDGDVGGLPLTPDRIGPRIADIAQTNFQAEWWSAPETDRDDPALLEPVAVAAGGTMPAVNVITNVDTIAPAVVSMTPPADSTGLRIDTSVLVGFSERIDPATLAASFRLHVAGDTLRLGGNGVLLGLGRTFVFTPTLPLQFGTDYVLDITTALADREGVHLEAPFTSAFRTEPRPPVALTSIQPSGAPARALITLLGTGFDATAAQNLVVFPCPSCALAETTVAALNAGPTSLVAAVPQGALTGLVRVETATAGTSNSLTFTLLAPQPIAAPARLGADIPLAFTPSDVAVAPDGSTVFAVGDGGLAIVNLDPQRPLFRVPENKPAGAGRSIALTPDGFRAVIARPATHDVVIVDANPSSGTFGEVVTTIPLLLDDGLSEPGTVTMAPDGRRAYVLDGVSHQVFEIDLDPASVTRDRVVGTRGTGGGLPSGALVATPDGRSLLLGTADQGLKRLLAPDAVDVLRGGSFGAAGAITPAGDQALFIYAGFGVGSGTVHLVAVDSLIADATVTLGGIVSDLAVLPQGPAGYVANGMLNRLQVVSLDRGSPLYRAKIAEVVTGSSPAAIGVSAFGNLIAVANAASRDLSLFQPLSSSGLGVRSMTPEVAIPGQPVGFLGDDDWLTVGSQVDLGTGPFPVTRNWNGSAVAFTTPALSQRATDVSVVLPTGERTVPLPFRIVDPVTSPVVRSTGLADRQVIVNTLFGFMSHQFQHVCVSPDGRMLAVGRYLGGNPTQGGAFIDLYRISSDGAQPFAQHLIQFRASSSPDNIRDMAFTPDSRFLWRGHDEMGCDLFDAQPASPTFGTSVRSLTTDPEGSDMLSLSTDPMGRYMMLGTSLGQSLAFFYPDGTGKQSVLGLPDKPWSSAVSPDGRYVVLGGQGRATLVDADSRTVLLSTPPHGDASPAFGSRVRSVAVTRDGKRAAGLFPGDLLGVWNLDPANGVIGDELYFGPFLPAAGTGAVTSELVTGTDLTSLLVGQGPHLLQVDLSAVPPVVTALASPGSIGLFAVSPDGRQLWNTRTGVDSLAREFGEVEYLSLIDASALQAVSGGGQTALPGTVLPTPVRVRVAAAGNRPLAGALVEFFAAGGALDGGPAGVRKLTDALGEAVVQWRVPSTLGPATLTATVLGSSAAPLAVTATVAPDDASIEPVIVSFGPPDGATDLGAATPVAVRFNQPMDSLSTVARIGLRAGDRAVSGRFRFEDGGRYVILTPDALLPYSAACTLAVAAGALDRDGQALATGGMSTFTVQPLPALALRSISPPAAPEGAPIVLDGAGFSAVPSQNTVLVNGRLAGVSTATTTSLVVHIPTGATSGPVTVQVGATTSNPQNVVVVTGDGVGGEIGSIPGEPGAARVAITPDGKRALVVNEQTNTVTALDLTTLQTIESITVGLAPRGVVILPNDPQGARAYVCNSGSDDVSVIDLMAGSPTVYQVVKTIPVGSRPSAIGVSGIGPQVLVVNSGDKTVSIIDCDATHATFDAVTSSVNVGSGGTAIAISPDGGRGFVVTSDGHVVILDIKSGAVMASVNVGSGGTAIAISPDGGTLLVLLTNGTLVAIDVVPGSPRENQVVASVNVGSGGQAVAVSPDGGTVYVTSAENTVIVIELASAPPSGSSFIQPGPAITLTVVATLPVGDAPAGIAVDPSGSGLLLVVSRGSGTVSVFGPQTAPVAVEFDLHPSAINLRSAGRWLMARLEPPAPWRAAQIRLGSIRLMGVLPIDSTARVSYGDGDCDGIPDVIVRFSRLAASLVIPTGAKVFVHCTGTLDSLVARTFDGVDSVKVKRARVLAPVAHEHLTPGTSYTVRWEAPEEDGHHGDDSALPVGRDHVLSVTLLLTLDGGATWAPVLEGLANTGSAAWIVPAAATDSAKLAVVFVTGDDDDSPLPVEPDPDHGADITTGVLALSEPFSIVGATTDVAVIPARLELAPARPNPARGAALLRFGLPVSGPVRLEVFDVAGRRVRVLADGIRAAGWHEARWRGENEARSRVGAGLYFVRLNAAGRTLQQRVVWMP